MKYIRTQEGHIYEYVEQRIYPSQYTKFGLYKHNLNSEYELIIAQADTIEELCDEFVVASNTPLVKMNPKIQKNMEFEEISQTYVKSKKNSIVYGAIWTDKGLIYVAKLNEKGEFELWD